MNVIMIIMMGFSPSGATGADMKILTIEYSDMKKCEIEAKNHNQHRTYGFNINSFCVNK